jgi:hypothetical protein
MVTLTATIEGASRSIAEGEDSIIGGIEKEDSRIETEIISIKDRIIRRRTWRIKKRNLSHKQQVTERHHLRASSIMTVTVHMLQEKR